MARPKKRRRIGCRPASVYFKPRGIPLTELAEVVLEQDELEAMRLADYLAFSHERGAAEMRISRATFGRIVERGRKKVTEAILRGKALRMDFAPMSTETKSNERERP
ncbi:MAG: DUF134 domain-containing protein [Bacteroidetes bacterium]|nr:MAG: DUF134 domain-containing protein [Bacteroidota bacterium]